MWQSQSVAPDASHTGAKVALISCPSTTGPIKVKSDDMSRKSIPLADRLWPKVNKTEACWIWTASANNQGYGQIWHREDGKPRLAHRLVYELLIGPVPEGLTLDHTCRNPLCVNPAHLEPVTQRENIARGMSPGAIAQRTGRCRRGHFDWHTRPDGRRYCRECRRLGRRYV